MKIHLALCNSDRWENNRGFYSQPLAPAQPLSQQAGGCSLPRDPRDPTATARGGTGLWCQGRFGKALSY